MCVAAQEERRLGAGLAQDWSGPYGAEEGEYYYNHRLKARSRWSHRGGSHDSGTLEVSTWDCPVTEWEQASSGKRASLSLHEKTLEELMTRQAVLYWCRSRKRISALARESRARAFLQRCLMGPGRPDGGAPPEARISAAACPSTRVISPRSEAASGSDGDEGWRGQREQKLRKRCGRLWTGSATSPAFAAEPGKAGSCRVLVLSSYCSSKAAKQKAAARRESVSTPPSTPSTARQARLDPTPEPRGPLH